MSPAAHKKDNNMRTSLFQSWDINACWESTFSFGVPSVGHSLTTAQKLSLPFSSIQFTPNHIVRVRRKTLLHTKGKVSKKDSRACVLLQLTVRKQGREARKHRRCYLNVLHISDRANDTNKAAVLVERSQVALDGVIREGITGKKPLYWVGKTRMNFQRDGKARTKPRGAGRRLGIQG